MPSKLFHVDFNPRCHTLPYTHVLCFSSIFIVLYFAVIHCEVYLKYLREGYKKEGNRLFSRVCCDRTMGNSFKLKEGVLGCISDKGVLQ